MSDTTEQRVKRVTEPALQMMQQWFQDNQQSGACNTATVDLFRTAKQPTANGNRLYAYAPNMGVGEESWSAIKSAIHVGTGQPSWVGLVQLIEAGINTVTAQPNTFTAWPFIKALARTDCPFKMYIVLSKGVDRVQELLIVYVDLYENGKLRTIVPVCKFIWSQNDLRYNLYNITKPADVNYH